LDSELESSSAESLNKPLKAEEGSSEAQKILSAESEEYPKGAEPFLEGFSEVAEWVEELSDMVEGEVEQEDVLESLDCRSQ